MAKAEPGRRAAAFWQRMAAPVDASSIAFFRIGLGCLLLYDFLRMLSLGLVQHLLVAPELYFTYAGFDWVRPLPGDGMYYLFYLLAIAAIGLAVGVWYRLAALVLLTGLVYVLLLDQSRYQNHSYLLCLIAFLMVLIPAHRTCTLRHREPGTVPLWCLRLLQFQIAIPYVFGGLVKLNPDWLSGASLQWRLVYDPSPLAVAVTTDVPWVPLFMSYAGLLLDLLIVPALCWRRTRVSAFALAVAFHVLNKLFFYIDIFPYFMIIASTIFFPPDWPRILLARFRGLGWDAPSPRACRPPAMPGVLRLVLVAYVAVQLLLPLLPLFSPGNSNWTRVGQRFGWRMMLNSIAARDFAYIVEDPRTGATFQVEEIADLTFRQVSVLPRDPDCMQIVARDIADSYERQEGVRPRVRARSELSLNGRRFQPLIDTSADLAAEPRSWGSKWWVIPLEVPLSDQLDLPLAPGPAPDGKTWSRRRRAWVDLPGAAPLPEAHRRTRRD